MVNNFHCRVRAFDAALRTSQKLRNYRFQPYFSTRDPKQTQSVIKFHDSLTCKTENSDSDTELLRTGAFFPDCAIFCSRFFENN